MSRTVALVACTFGAFALAGCVTVDGPETPARTAGGSCHAEPARALVGQKASTESGARVLSLTHAKALRWGPPGAVWTMDYREDRANVRYDDAMTITEITCG